jgi:hypothetical protein
VALRAWYSLTLPERSIFLIVALLQAFVGYNGQWDAIVAVSTTLSLAPSHRNFPWGMEKGRLPLDSRLLSWELIYCRVFVLACYDLIGVDSK